MVCLDVGTVYCVECIDAQVYSVWVFRVVCMMCGCKEEGSAWVCVCGGLCVWVWWVMCVCVVGCACGCGGLCVCVFGGFGVGVVCVVGLVCVCVGLVCVWWVVCVVGYVCGGFGVGVVCVVGLVCVCVVLVCVCGLCVWWVGCECLWACVCVCACVCVFVRVWGVVCMGVVGWLRVLTGVCVCASFPTVTSPPPPQAPQGAHVYLQFIGAFGIAGHMDVCKDYVEVRYNTSLALTGAR